MTFKDVSGHYFVISPYHKNKKRLPFNIDNTGFVSTVEYRGKTAFYRNGWYTLETILSLIQSGIIKRGLVDFPRCKEANWL